jgi:nucleotide-binding universal stress UspA family protein
MTKPIIVAVDPRRPDHEPLALGLRLARLADAPLRLAATFRYDGLADRHHPELADALRTEAEAALRVAAALLRDAPGVTPRIETSALPTASSPARALQDLALETDAILLVIGSSARGPLGRVGPGAVTDRLLHGAPCAVAVAPRGISFADANRPLGVVGAGYMDAPDAHAALRAALAIAGRAGGHLRVLVVARPPDWTVLSTPFAMATPDDELVVQEEAQAQAEGVLRHGLELGTLAGQASGAVLHGTPADALASESHELDLLVCGSRDFGPLRTLMHGSTSHALVRRAACAVLVVPRGAEEALVGAFGSGNPQPSRPEPRMTAREPAHTVPSP